jgi:hypothetical protein
MRRRPFRHHTFRALALALAASALLSAGGCASGPSDFMQLVSFNSDKPKGPVIRTEKQQQALAASLSADRRGQSADTAVEPGASSALALTVIRQQQSEEAKALLTESGVLAGGVAAAESCVDPAGGPAACPAPVSP